MTFRGGYERDIKDFIKKTPELKTAVEAEDDDTIETIVNERFYHRPEMFYSPDKLILSYGVPATTPGLRIQCRRPPPVTNERRDCRRHGGFHRGLASTFATTNRNGWTPPPNCSQKTLRRCTAS